MFRLLVRLFVRDRERTGEPSVRAAYGVLAGGLGIFNNLLLFAIKVAVGLLTGSIAVISDAFNNLTDSGSSIIAIIGSKLSSMPPDEEHPHGHGRVEYVASLAIAFIILFVGLQLLFVSAQKIMAPEPISYTPTLLGILLATVLVKLWMYSYNQYVGQLINSSINRATAFDSLNDAVATSAVIASMLLSTRTDLPLDGIAGVGVSLFVLRNGYLTLRETVDLLIGTTPSPELVRAIENTILKGKYVLDTHGLRVHEYGPGRVAATIHVDVPPDVSISAVHASINALEEQVARELGVNIVIHMDPLDNLEHPGHAPLSVMVVEAPDDGSSNLAMTENDRVVG